MVLGLGEDDALTSDDLGRRGFSAGERLVHRRHQRLA
jgi:hypothetical protein